MTFHNHHGWIGITMAGLLAGSIAWAQEVPTEGTQISPVNQPESLRDPFWPPGFTPAPEDDETPVQAVDNTPPSIDQAKWPQPNVQGVTRGPDGKYFAIISDVGVVESDQEFSIRKGPFIFVFRVNAITSRGVKYKQVEIRPAR